MLAAKQNQKFPFHFLSAPPTPPAEEKVNTSVKKITPQKRGGFSKTEGERFELSVGFPTHAFQACALDHYANPPN